MTPHERLATALIIGFLLVLVLAAQIAYEAVTT